MKKVFYSVQAAEDLENIFCGLATWEKHPMELLHVAAYVSDIRKACDKLGTNVFHRKCTYKIHQQYGNYILAYRRTSSTVWYIIYNIDKEENIRIEKIINNYITTE
jgi:plasmid stabilization system protein ParE